MQQFAFILTRSMPIKPLILDAQDDKSINCYVGGGIP